MKTKRILVATDFSSASDRAVETAIDMAGNNGTELLFAHAYVPPVASQADAVAPGVYEEWDRNLRNAVGEKLEPLVEKAKKRGIKARSLILSGTPYEAIADAAEKNQADLVVMGTHGRKGVARFFVGSVASRVISIAPCPVLTVRA
jgi:nucleotide-binding universal stress UspA family protein